MKKQLSLLITMILISICIVFTPTVAKADATSGQCGENVTWTYENETITFSGSGAMYASCEKLLPEEIVTNAKKAVIGDGITTIGSHLFYGFRQLTTVTLPDSMLEIGDYAFCSSINLETINFPNGLKRIGYMAFAYNWKMTKAVLPDSIEIMGYGFYRAYALAEVTLPKTLKQIDEGAFYSCSDLAYIKIPDSCEKICAKAFYDCHNLGSVEIPTTVTYIGEYAFSGCTPITISGYKNSYAETFAKDNDITFYDLFAKRDVPHYDITKVGGEIKDTDGKKIFEYNGEIIKDAFVTDGTYTYYFQADGSAMTNRLTYHPDGAHIIYFDENGHEVFNSFANVKKSIEGKSVDDLCYFGVYGYMYIDVITFDITGSQLYYINPCGVMERNGWFFIPNTAKWANGYKYNLWGASNKTMLGYAYPDGRLARNESIYNDSYQKTLDIDGDGCVKQSSLSQ